MAEAYHLLLGDMLLAVDNVLLLHALLVSEQSINMARPLTYECHILQKFPTLLNKDSDKIHRISYLRPRSEFPDAGLSSSNLRQEITR